MSDKKPIGVRKTKRKGFNFMRSYMDVYFKLPTDEDKVQFMKALLEKQFFNIEPAGLNLMTELAYTGLQHSIESSVQGWESKTDILLKIEDSEGAKQGAKQGGAEGPSLQLNRTELNRTTTELNRTEQNRTKIYQKSIHDCLDKCLKFFDDHLHPDTESKKNKWLDTIEKLERIDKIPLDYIPALVEKVRKDDFWAANFLSLVKLRKKNKDGVSYIIVFHEKFKNEKSNSNQRRTNTAIDPKELQNWLNK